jgi:tetratricopeptide (TPR) repeat protein
VVAAETSLQKTPNAGNPLRAVHINENLHTDGIEGEWFRVRLPDGTHAYINSLHILLPPRTVDAGGVSLGAKACSMSTSATNPLPSGSLGTVLTAERFAKPGLCYLIKTSEGEGWVAASQVRRIYSLPIVQFTAGLYRYQLGRYDLAATEFRNYVQLESSAQDPPSLSSAYQLLAASELMGDIPHSRSAALSALQSAIGVTPYDASAYSMRALAMLSNQQTFVGASLRDLSEALELDPDQPDARNTVALLIGIKPGKFNPLAQEGVLFTMTEQDSSTLKSLASKYAIDPR